MKTVNCCKDNYETIWMDGILKKDTLKCVFHDIMNIQMKMCKAKP